ncbi:ead/Ea22-like family protein, partial [Enterobacter asburiae]
MSNIDKQALNQEKIEWLNKLADMEYCKSNPGHWLMSLKDTNMLAKLALRSVALLDELEAAEKRIAELEVLAFNPALLDVISERQRQRAVEG